MDQNKLEMVAEYYSTKENTYKRNEKYSKGGHEVFNVSSSPSEWLTFSETKSGVMATKTDGNGVIQSWDTYDITRNYPRSLMVERLAQDGRNTTSFSEDEQNVIQQFGETGKADTVQRLESVIPLVRDKQAKEILTTTKDKLGALSDVNCADLIAYVKCRKEIEHGRSLKVKLEKLKAEIKARDSTCRQQQTDRQFSKI